MKNIILIKGKEMSGKTFLAKQLSLIYNEPIWIDGRQIKNEQAFPFVNVTATTDLIIIDDLPSFWNVNELLAGENIEVNIPAKPTEYFPFPTVIITTTSDFKIKKAMEIQCSYCEKHFQFSKTIN